MPIKVNLPDGRVVNFPDGMSQADIEKAITEVSGETKPPQEEGAISRFVGAAAPYFNPVTIAKGLGQTMEDMMDPVGRHLRSLGPAMLAEQAAREHPSVRTVTDAISANAPPLSPAMNVTRRVAEGDYAGAAGEAAGFGGSMYLLPKAGIKAGRLIASAAKVPIRSAFKGMPSYMEDHPGVADTLLKERLYPTEGGVNKLWTTVDQLNERVNDATKASSARIDPQAIASQAEQRLLGPQSHFTQQNTPGADVGAIAAALEEFRQHPNFRAPTPDLVAPDVPVQTVQRMKQASSRHLRGQFGIDRNATTEANKSLYHGEREAIAQKVPEVAPLNARESALIEAAPVVERSAARRGNLDLLGLKDYAGLLSGRPKGMLSLLDWPLVKANIAHGMYGTGNVLGSSASVLRALILARLAGSEPPEQP